MKKILGPHTVTYHISYSNKGWVVFPSEIPNEDDRKKVNNALNLSNNENQEIVFEAFEKAHKVFLPYVKLQDAAWNYHRLLYQKYKDEGKELTCEALLIEKREWPVAWYWKSAFHMLRNPKLVQLKKYRIRICQIRQWVMFIGYTEDGNLACPPLFGRSDRLHAWDQYWLYLAFFKEIKEHYKLAPDSELDLAYVLGRHDVTYNILNFEPVENKQNCYKIELEARLCLEPYNETFKLINMLSKEEKKKRPAHRTYFKSKYWKKNSPSINLHSPYNLVRVPCYKNKTESEDADSEGCISFLLSSDRYCAALSQMSEVWNDPTAKAVMVIAPPGSGKECLASSAYHFRDYKSTQGELITTALSSKEDGESLFRIKNDLSPFRGNLGKLIKKDRYKKGGFILQAEGGVLFIDEIDKAPPSIRNSLLRLLENDSFVVPGTAVVIPVDKKMPFYIFAGSKPQLEIFMSEPVDFWTRISHVIVMEHPLGIEDEETRSHVIREYFQMFWNRHVPKFFGHSKGIAFVPFGEKAEAQVIDKYYLDMFNFFLSKSLVDFLSIYFSREIINRGPVELPSVRNIATIAGRVCYELFEMLAHPKRETCALQRFRNNLCVSRANIGIPWFVLVQLILAEENDWERIREEYDIGKDLKDLHEMINNICPCDERNSVRKDFENTIKKASQLVMQFTGLHNNQNRAKT